MSFSTLPYPASLVPGQTGPNSVHPAHFHGEHGAGDLHLRPSPPQFHVPHNVDVRAPPHNHNGLDHTVRPRPAGRNPNLNASVIHGSLWELSPSPSNELGSLVDVYRETSNSHRSVRSSQPEMSPHRASLLFHRMSVSDTHAQPRFHHLSTDGSSHAVPGYDLVKSNMQVEHDLTLRDRNQDDTLLSPPADTIALPVPLRTAALTVHINRHGYLPHGATDAEPFDKTTWETAEALIPIDERPFRRPQSVAESIMSNSFIEPDQLNDENIQPSLIQYIRIPGHHVMDELRTCLRRAYHAPVLHRTRSQQLISSRDGERMP